MKTFSKRGGIHLSVPEVGINAQSMKEKDSFSDGIVKKVQTALKKLKPPLSENISLNKRVFLKENEEEGEMLVLVSKSDSAGSIWAHVFLNPLKTEYLVTFVGIAQPFDFENEARLFKCFQWHKIYRSEESYEWEKSRFPESVCEDNAHYHCSYFEKTVIFGIAQNFNSAVALLIGMLKDFRFPIHLWFKDQHGGNIE